MKILTAGVSLALTLGLHGLTPAMAESFNDKSIVNRHTWSQPSPTARYDERSGEQKMSLSTTNNPIHSQGGVYCELTVSQSFNEASTAQRTC